MKKNTLRFLLFIGFTFISLFITAQTTAPDEDTGTYTTCNPDGENATRTSDDLPNPVNVGTIDDRSCYANYKESNVYGKIWGNYNITHNSNNQDAPNTLQPRIERSLSRSQTTGVGSYARFTGTVRILEVGDAGSFNQDGTYIAQAKGKHTGDGGSNDPAICLYLAKPVYGTGANANMQVSFDIYAERILTRGGEGSGREVVFLKRVNKNDEIDFELEVGFREDPNDATKKIHYCDAVIGGEAFNWNIPEPERGVESGIRYGAYRVKGGRAQIRWANTTYQKVENLDNGNTTPADDIYRLRNVATGKFLTDAGTSAAPVTMTDSGEAENTHWTFVESGAFFNIESETFGILRAPGSGGPGGAYVVVSTSKASPASDSDKVWTIHHNESENTYRFQSGNSGRYLYHETNGDVTHIIVSEGDDRSNWEVIPTSQSLSVSDEELSASSIKVFPNPAEDTFTIAFKNLSNAKVRITDVLGKIVYQASTYDERIQLSKADGFSLGLYIIQVSDENGRTINKKIMMK
jgi:hypothetical protein